MTVSKTMDLEVRRQAALDAAKDGAELALQHYHAIESLQIEEKGVQDLVSNADREVEVLIREFLGSRFPDDGIVGEEFENKRSDNGFSWVIDPIDGTASFVRGRPGWCVVIACVYNDATVIGVVHDPVANEVFDAVRAGGARLNSRQISASTSGSLSNGALGVGFNKRFPPDLCLKLLERLIVEQHGVFYQNGSGALMLAYVASGRLLGFAEPHMFPWDCMAALLIIEEAGGMVQPYDQKNMLEHGDRVVTACSGVYDQLTAMTDDIFSDYRLTN